MIPARSPEYSAALVQVINWLTGGVLQKHEFVCEFRFIYQIRRFDSPNQFAQIDRRIDSPSLKN